MRGGVEVHRADAAFTADGATYRRGQLGRAARSAVPAVREGPARAAALSGPPREPRGAADSALRHRRLDAVVPDGRDGDSRRAPARRADDEAGSVPGRHRAHPRWARSGRSRFGRLSTNGVCASARHLHPRSRDEQFVPRGQRAAGRRHLGRARERASGRQRARDGAGRVHRHGQDKGRSGSRGERRRAAGRHRRARHASAAT